MTTEIRPTADLVAVTAAPVPARSAGGPAAGAPAAAPDPVPGPAAAPAPNPGPGAAPRRRGGAPEPGRPAGPGLALVDRRQARKARLRRTLAVTFIAVLVVTLFAVGLVQAQLVQRQHRLDELRSDIADTRAEHLRLSREVVVASSPQEIVRRATEMGMVRAQDPVYLVGVRPAADG